ncbi:hypothetical protein ACP275_14G082300 [Erythranthe tilingii]
MDRVCSSGSDLDLDLDVDLESGGTTSEEDASVLKCENSKILLCRKNGGECSCSYDKCIFSDENLGAFREEEMISYVDKSMDDEKPKKKKKKHSKPPRPPTGPSIGVSDMKLLKEISEINMKRRRLEKIRMKKIKKEKTSSLSANLFACLVTIVFVLVIVFHDYRKFSSTRKAHEKRK